jgi:hypothetical protein
MPQEKKIQSKPSKINRLKKHPMEHGITRRHATRQIQVPKQNMVAAEIKSVISETHINSPV